MGIPKTRLIKGAHYKVYISGGRKGHPTKAEMSRRGLAKAIKLGTHDPKRVVDFIPIEFSIQYHAWGNFKFNTFPAIKAFIRRHINEPDLEGKLGGKGHFDLRHQKLKASSWFGITIYHRPPWQGTAGDKALGSFKGVMQLTAPGRKLRAAIKKEHGFTPKGLVTMETGAPKFMDAEYYIPPGKAATTNKWPEVMVLIEHRMPAVLHRRDFDFMDITYLGKYMKGRYYFRLVTRELKPEEMPKTYKKKTKTNVYGWRAKSQFPEPLMRQVASGKIRLSPKSLLRRRK